MTILTAICCCVWPETRDINLFRLVRLAYGAAGTVGMPNNIAATNGPTIDSVLRECDVALQQVAAYRLPPALDRRLLWLSENKESLTQEEREELLELVDLTQERTVEKLRARLVLKQIAEMLPHLHATQS